MSQKTKINPRIAKTAKYPTFIITELDFLIYNKFISINGLFYDYAKQIYTYIYINSI